MIRAAPWVATCDLHVRLKTTATAIKIAKETTENQWKIAKHCPGSRLKTYHICLHESGFSEKFYSQNFVNENCCLCFTELYIFYWFIFFYIFKMNWRQKNRSKLSFYRHNNIVYIKKFLDCDWLREMQFWVQKE